jgi:hypothetical protein
MRIQALRNFIHLWGFNRRIILSTVFVTIKARNVERVECHLTKKSSRQSKVSHRLQEEEQCVRRFSLQRIANVRRR